MIKIGKNQLISLTLIVLLAAFLRLYQLGDFPVGFHIDEVQVGYNAYSLLKTGRDELGNFLPHHLNIFGFSRPTALFYLTMPAIAALGLNEFATRLPTAILGVLTVIVFYFFIKLLFRQPRLATMAALLLAVSPWHIIFSRATTENILELFCLLLGVYFLFAGLKKGKRKGFFLSYCFFFLAYFAYFPSRVFVPLLLFGFGLIFFKELLKKGLFKIFLLVAILYFLVPFGLFMFKLESMSRFKQIGIFTNPGVQLELEEQIREDGGVQPLVTRFFHNKPLNYSLKFLENYQEYFTGKFLFTFGGFPMRFRIPQMGVLYFFELPFLLWGLFQFLKKKAKEHLFFLYWLLAAPVAASLTVEDVPNFQRVLLMLPALEVMIATGIFQAIIFFKKMGFFKIGVLIIILGYSYGLVFFLHQYFHHQRVHRPWYRHAEMKQLVEAVNQRGSDYEKIVITKNETEPYIFFLFFNKIDPAYFQEKVPPLFWEGTWEFDQFIFDQRDCPLQQEENPREDRLYVERSICKLEPWIKVIGEIKRPDDSVVLRLEEFDRSQFAPYLITREP